MIGNQTAFSKICNGNHKKCAISRVDLHGRSLYSKDSALWGYGGMLSTVLREWRSIAGSYDRGALRLDEDLQKVSILCSTFAEDMTLLIPKEFRMLYVHILDKAEPVTKSTFLLIIEGVSSKKAGLFNGPPPAVALETSLTISPCE
jgi:hypothetical protein